MIFLKFLWQKWLIVAQAIGNFQAQVILTVFYLVILWPVGLVMRFLADPLRMKKLATRTNFEKWEHQKQGLEGARKQY